MKRPLILLATFALGLLMLPAGALGDTAILGPGASHDETWILSSGDVIKWDWSTTGGGLDFYIEDLFGAEYSEMHDAQTSQGQFMVPEDGFWSVHFENNGATTVTLDYSLTVEDKSAEDFMAIFLLPILLGVIALVVIIIIVVLLLTKKKPAKPPQYPPQQPGYPPQQPPGQYPPQQPGYPPQQPPAQPPSQP
jgi:hypothetical protein